MIAYTKIIKLNSKNGGQVVDFKLPSDCKVIKSLLITTDISAEVDHLLTNLEVEKISNLKSEYIGEITLSINNANEFLIKDNALFLNIYIESQKLKDTDTGFRAFIRSSNSQKNSYNNKCINNTGCKLVFKYNNRLATIKQNIKTGYLWSAIPEEFNLLICLNYDI